ncbi:glutathione binding-like protein [Seohaeicola zhoushanensis]|uniref:Thiol:disulfide oxidoreductase n=1 Tax=Seohaeicola zhoushanensis TaxID=1569283 RepID=A0A8J3M9M8_9RHOB|nr:glutathione binding-like protein [Seohaeicola zhoushanensis]GHF62199.1 thiol:disulfide oxidoreductase [Seohaeicola zhoushanensis]
MIDLHYVATGNNLKIAIMLEETGLEYRLVRYEMFRGDHLTPEFRRINPNCKLPAIVDRAPADGGDPFAVFESGAILTYLAEKSGRFIPEDPRGRSLCQQWLAWQIAGLGPMHGQAHHFIRYAPEGQHYAVARYRSEAERLLHVMEYRLAGADYLAGEYSIADMACFPWLGGLSLIGLTLDALPHLAAWHDRIAARPAVQAARQAIMDENRALYARAKAELTPEQWSAMFGDRMHRASRTL